MPRMRPLSHDPAHPSWYTVYGSVFSPVWGHDKGISRGLGDGSLCEKTFLPWPQALGERGLELVKS